MGDYMNIGDYVTRNSHNNDLIFIITDIQDDIAYLKGVNIRLVADSNIDDLKKVKYKKNDDEKIIDRMKEDMSLDRDDYFYLPGKILHIDSDKDYLNRCIKYYKDMNLMAMGICEDEDKIQDNIKKYLEEYNPSILVITGHDAFYKKKGSKEDMSLDRDDYFYLPGKILHIDSDQDYLNRCIKYYKDMNLMAMGICEEESKIQNNIKRYLEDYNPSILVITGHDAYYKKKGSKADLNNYKNSQNFVNAIKEARKYEKSHDALIIIAGACQSNYEELIKAGANFASSPKRVNIHALDPAIIASQMSLSDISKDIDLKKIILNTKYGKDGIGGIITKGCMYVGYPR